MLYSNEDYHNLLKGQRVVIVGPAPYMKGSGLGEEIDNYDVVVRINKAVPVPKELKKDIGGRTTILYNCLEPHPDSGGVVNGDMWKSYGVKVVASPYPYHAPFDKDIDRYLRLYDSPPLHIIDGEMFQGMAHFMECRPNSGVCAICDLLSTQLKSLTVYGFTMYRGGYYSEYHVWDEKTVMEKMAKTNHHKQEGQVKAMKKLLKTDPRLIVDQHLLDALDSYEIK